MTERRPAPRPAADRASLPAEALPFVPLPQRTTHGGDFGPVVREKLTRLALERGRW